MTRQEARSLLNNSKPKGNNAYSTMLNEALDMAIKALEQEQKSEWEHDHEILKAYSDGASDILEKIRAEFVSLYPKNYAGEPELGGLSCVFSLNKVLEIIDKYKTESEDKE